MKTYDLAMNWNSKDDAYFAELIRSLCRKNKISFLWIYYGNADKTYYALKSSSIRINILMDTDATYEDPEDIFAKICYAVKDTGGTVLNDPDKTKIAIDKAYMAGEMDKLGIITPYTYIIRKWMPKKVTIPKNIMSKLGKNFVIKPSHGYAQRGIIRSATGSMYQINKARMFDPKDDFLLQKKIVPVEIGGNRAWFRILYMFGHIIPFWWNDITNRYKHITLTEYKKYGLSELVNITLKLAGHTGMEWFSTEIAVDMYNNRKRFNVIDYINDQCDLTPVSKAPNGLPANIVDKIAGIVLRKILDLKRSRKTADKPSKIIFADKKILKINQ